MTARWGWLAWLTAAYAAAVLAQLPAAVLADWLALPTGGAVLSGSAWRGAARVSPPDVPGLAVRWRLLGRPVTAGCAGAALDARGDGGALVAHGEVGYCPLDGRWYAEDVNFRAGLVPWSGVLRGGLLAVAGTLEGNDVDLSVAGGDVSADGTLRWEEASVDAGTPVVLGIVHATLIGAARGVALEFANSGGEVGLQGRALLELDRRYQVNVDVEPRGVAALADWLRDFATPAGNGHYLLRDAGTF